MCVDASAALQVRALKDYCNNYDLTSLNIKAGDVITVRLITVCLYVCPSVTQSTDLMKNNTEIILHDFENLAAYLFELVL